MELLLGCAKSFVEATLADTFNPPPLVKHTRAAQNSIGWPLLLQGQEAFVLYAFLVMAETCARQSASFVVEPSFVLGGNELNPVTN